MELKKQKGIIKCVMIGLMVCILTILGVWLLSKTPMVIPKKTFEITVIIYSVDDTMQTTDSVRVFYGDFQRLEFGLEIVPHDDTIVSSDSIFIGDDYRFGYQYEKEIIINEDTLYFIQVKRL